MAEEVFTLEQVAKMLDVSERTVIRQITAGKLRGFKVGKSWRFRRSAIDEYIKSQEDSAKDDVSEDDETKPDAA